ncbi:MAG: DNA cytosine methyltransferase [Deferribacteraceae bacterium]|jgi:DNA (cytosine-5)-methyltransferase 1|nr:DNA cytosine methyltransferase [Deferribacteraceae bacterium]
MKAIDLFAGCGGFSTGFVKAEFKITHAVEFDKTIARTYALNHPSTTLIVDDIQNINNSIFQPNSVDVIIGGPPCQGFSMAGARIRQNFIDDQRNYLFRHYFNIVSRVRPKVFVMENVKGIQTMNNPR